MRVLLTGIAGFVGSHVAEHILQTTDWDVTGLVSFQHKGCPLRIHDDNYDRKRVKLVYHDLRAPITGRIADAIGPVDVILNVAADSHVDRSITDPRTCISNNVELILTMLDYARQVKPRIFLQVSTDEVYGPAPQGHNHEEWESHLPSNPYSASKAAQEDIAFSYWRTYGVPVVITNTMNIFGERQDPEKFVPLVISKVMNGETVQIHGQDGKPGSRFYLHARNQADALLYLLRLPEGGSYTASLDPNDPQNHAYDCHFGAGILDALPNHGCDCGAYERLLQGHAQIWVRPPLVRQYTTERPVAGPSRYGALDRPSRINIVGEQEVDNLAMAHLIATYIGKPLKYEIVNFHASRPGHDLRYALDGSKLANYGWRAPVPFEESLHRMIEWSLKHPEWLDLKTPVAA